VEQVGVQVHVQFATLYLFVILLCPAHISAVLVQALLKEVVAYTKMEKLWGVFVPRLIGYGTTNNGRIVYVATELIEGDELGEGRIPCKTLKCGVSYSSYSGLEGFL
jgi:hypothetical protein